MNLRVNLLFILFFIVNIKTSTCEKFNCSRKAVVFNQSQWSSDSSINNFIKKQKENPSLKEIFDEIAIERQPNSRGHDLVLKKITELLQKWKWQVVYDEFLDETPKGIFPFTNIIAHQPDAIKSDGNKDSVYLACHYDSKMLDNFVGATDSAMSCAMILHLAEWISKYNPPLQAKISLLFFDGEEAFENWSDTDSLYGSRHLAKKWEENKENGCNQLKQMSLLILLDLLGAVNPHFYSYFSDTHYLHKLLRRIEQNARRSSLLWTENGHNFFSRRRQLLNGISDDHIPFYQRGVPTLHVISTPFPEVWHTQLDNKDAIHWNTVNDLINIFKIFLMSIQVK